MSRVPPVRTCVGCRERATKSELLRVVATPDLPGRAVAPDETGRQPGRGAHLHPTPECLDQAERRRAFPRALRLEGPLDTSALRVWVEAHQHDRQGLTRGLGLS
ncbi:MAG: YlxR family protein [Propionibacteriales bacterium]|nr:YlxR family protein [Propionibacteriales bacterium]